MKFMFSKFSFSKALILGFSLFVSYTATAKLTTVGDLIQVSITIKGNDCAGYFGANFNACEITHVKSGDTEVFASIMGKFDTENSSGTEFSAGSSASDWTFNGSSANSTDNRKNGTWKYVGNSYPGVSYWAVKGGPKFTLNWMINKSDKALCKNLARTKNCLSLALAVTEGSWLTPKNKNNDKRYDLSHISFYGNKCDNNCATTQVPEPTSIALFGLALLGLSARRRTNLK